MVEIENPSPQAEQMADESMVRTLAAQAEAIWPQEVKLFERYGLAPNARILDVGCGTGEIASRLAALYPESRVVGVDLIDAHLVLARARYTRFGERLRFTRANAFALPFADGAFDLAVCRHVIQAVPHPERLVEELRRVVRPGGRLHVIAEDYGMIHAHPTRRDLDGFWRDGPAAFGRATGTELYVGRQAYSLFRRLGLKDVAVDYVVVDPLRAPRATIAAIWEAWRDGYAAAIGRHTRFSADEARALFDDLIATTRDPDGYVVWQVPVVTGVVPCARPAV